MDRKGEEWASGQTVLFVMERCGVGTDHGGRRRRRVARAAHIWNCLAGPNSGGRSANQPFFRAPFRIIADAIVRNAALR